MRKWAALAFIVYAGAIVLSNFFIAHVGIPAGPVHLTYVWWGLLAPSGVWWAGLSFPARDVVQRIGGRWLGILAILVGAGLSVLTSNPHVAVASGVTYLCSESLDFAVYTPLQRKYFGWAVLFSAIAAAILDSILFLHLAGLPAGMSAVAGLILGKIWVQMFAAPAAWSLRRKGPMAISPISPPRPLPQQ